MIRAFLVLLLVFSVGACQRLQPVYVVQAHPVPAASADLGPELIMQYITGVAQSKGWLVDPVSSTEVRATQKWHAHTAVIIITTDGRTYSIRNDGSSNLLQQGDLIHREYNKRVHALEDAIEKRLYQRP